MRVLFFAHETTWSGAPVQLLHLVRWLHHHDHEVAVAVPKPEVSEAGPITGELHRLGIEVYPILDLSSLPHLDELGFLCEQFDVVVANTLTMWAAVHAAHERGVPSLWYIHESTVAEQLFCGVPEIRPTLALADLLVFPTHRTAAIYRGLTERPIEVIPYGIPAVELEPSKRNPASPIQFLLLGTYERRKGQDIYLDAIAKVDGNGRFVSAGRVLDLAFYQSLSEQVAKLTGCQLLEGLSHREALIKIAESDVIVCASRDETMPVALLEAMSLGKAVVSTMVGGVTEWLRDGWNALLVHPEDSSALAEAFTRLLAEPDLRQTLGRNAHETFARHFSIDTLGQRFVILLEGLRRSRGG